MIVGSRSGLAALRSVPQAGLEAVGSRELCGKTMAEIDAYYESILREIKELQKQLLSKKAHSNLADSS